MCRGYDDFDVGSIGRRLGRMIGIVIFEGNCRSDGGANCAAYDGSFLIADVLADDCADCTTDTSTYSCFNLLVGSPGECCGHKARARGN